MLYSLINDNDTETQVLTVLLGGNPYVATSDTHPNFKALVAKVLDNDESVVDDFTVERAVATRFEALSERVSVAGGQVYFDGDPVNDALTEQILRFVDAGEYDWMPLVAFFEKVSQNPNEHSREQLYRWLARHQFTLTREGDIVGYKGVREDLTSTHAGPAIVDGVSMNGHIPNQPGSEITMARSSVQFDPSVGCAQGLHVANWDYASNWDTKTLEVHVNPRDVVSVPTDSYDQKVRVCRYIVIGEVDEPYVGPVLEAPVDEIEEDDDRDYLDDDDDELDDDSCSVCGGDCGWCADEDEDDEIVWAPDVSFVSGTTTYGKYCADGTSKLDTRRNYLGQQRDANGRFIKK